MDSHLRLFRSCACTSTVAAAAGVTKPILYRHFESKRALYPASLVLWWMEDADVSRAAVLAALTTIWVRVLGASVD
jgi:hypothetical protein